MQAVVTAAGAYDVVIDRSTTPAQAVTAASQSNTVTITPLNCRAT